MENEYLELPECKPAWESGVPRCSSSCPSLVNGNLCEFLRDLTNFHNICIPMVQHMRHMLDRLQKEDQETEDVLKGLKEGGGPHG